MPMVVWAFSCEGSTLFVQEKQNRQTAHSVWDLDVFVPLKFIILEWMIQEIFVC